MPGIATIDQHAYVSPPPLSTDRIGTYVGWGGNPRAATPPMPTDLTGTYADRPPCTPFLTGGDLQIGHDLRNDLPATSLHELVS